MGICRTSTKSDDRTDDLSMTAATEGQFAKSKSSHTGHFHLQKIRQ
jgi:hypothetical protein